jgi:hypothetical protein
MEVIRVIELTRHDAVYVLHMRAEENRFGPEFLAAIGSALDEVERRRDRRLPADGATAARMRSQMASSITQSPRPSARCAAMRHSGRGARASTLR